MPSRFPWSKTSSTQQYNADPALDIPRSSSRQELAYNIRQSPLEGSYNPYTQAQHHSTSSFDSSSPPPTANPPYSQPLGIQEQTIASQPYEQHPLHPAQASSQVPSQRNQSSKKSLRSKLLGTSSKEEPETIFGRKRSVQRKEAPTAVPNTNQQKLHAGPWPLNTQVGQPSNQPGTFEPYSPDFATAPIESREYQSSLPPTAPQHGEQLYQYQQQAQGRQTPLQSYRNPLAEDSARITTPPTRLSFESLQPPSRPDSRPLSRQSQDRQPLVVSHGQISQQDSYQTQSIQDPNRQYAQQGSQGVSMIPPPGPRQQRQNYSVDTAKINPISRENSFAPNPNQLGGPESNPQNAQNLTAGMQRGQQSTQEGEMRARTPPPPRSASEMTEAEVNQLIRDHREMKQKYNNVKRQYFDKRDQVDALQNTLAHQRLAQSRTHWDDGEYITRMTRLDGLISQLAFGMRKDWKFFPDWLQSHCNKDALQVGKQEMTAVGRAFVSRWLADELFDKYFHPGLPPEMSADLKWIQRNMREFAPLSHSGEEKDALTAKIINWRLATVDGLHSILSSSEANSNKQSLVQLLNERLLQDIKKHMQQDPPPTGLEGGVHMVIELSVAILASLPLESRDIHVDYFLPDHPIMQDFMKVESSGIPPLLDSAPALESAEGDQGPLKGGRFGNEGNTYDMEAESGTVQDDPSKRGFLSGFANKRPNSPQRPFAIKQGAQGGASQTSLPQQTGASREERVRMCLFLSVENRGKMVLFKAPVFGRT